MGSKDGLSPSAYASEPLRTAAPRKVQGARGLDGTSDDLAPPTASVPGYDPIATSPPGR